MAALASSAGAKIRDYRERVGTVELEIKQLEASASPSSTDRWRLGILRSDRTILLNKMGDMVRTFIKLRAASRT